jgi:asparagine synthase (glutamine-hydrolysing)
MSAILAVFDRKGQAVAEDVVTVMLAATSERAVDGQACWFGEHAAVAHQHMWITPEEVGERQPLWETAGKRILAADARLDNRADLLKALDREAGEAQLISDAHLILMAYRRWGTDCVKRLLGSFAFVIWDAEGRQLFAARDALGSRGLAYYVDEKRCVVGSEIRQILAHPKIEARTNEGKIGDFLIGVQHHQEETLYEDIFHCPPAHCLLVKANSVRIWRYWEFDPGKRIRYGDDQAYADHFLELLTEAVRCRLRAAGPVGISLSGGLDSTTVAAVASVLLPEMGLPQERLFSFSNVFDELRRCDERPFIQAVVDRYDVEATYIPSDGMWPLRDMERWPVYRDFIWFNPYPRLGFSVMEAAQQKGCRVLLSGSFGDHLYAGDAAWAAGMMADLRLGQLAEVVLKERSHINLKRDIVNNGLRQMIPHRMRMMANELRGTKAYHRSIHPDLIERAQLADRVVPNQARRPQFGPDQWHRYCSLVLNAVAEDESSAAAAYNRYGLEHAMPYWDRRLIEYVLMIPADKLGRPPRDRSIVRDATMQLLPKQVRERRWKTEFLPLFDKGLLQKETETAARILRDPYIVKDQYVRAEWLTDQLADGKGWQDDGQKFMLWKFLCLELWLSLYYS